jgi:hypothetical protein
MLKEDGHFALEECYTVCGREYKYTLIKLFRESRARLSKLEKFLNIARIKYGIIKNNVFGYDSVSSNMRFGGKIQDHPGFLLMVEQMNAPDSKLEWWMFSGDTKTNKNGLLFGFRNDIDIRDLTAGELRKKTYTCTKEHEELKKKHEKIKSLLVVTQTENEQLRARVKRQHEIICDYEQFVKENQDLLKQQRRL